MDVALAFQDLDERFEAKVAARRDEVLLACSGAAAVVLPHFLLVARFGESCADRLFDAHARGRVPRRLAEAAEIRALGVLSESEFDSRHRALEGQFFRGLAPAQLNNDSLAADGVRAAVQDVCRGDAARQVAIDVDVVGIEYIRDVRDGRNGDAAFVDAAVYGDVRMAINDSGNHELPRGVNHLRAFWRFDGLADGGDLSVFDQDGAMLDGAVRHGQNRRVLNQDHLPRLRRSRRGVRRSARRGCRSGVDRFAAAQDNECESKCQKCACAVHRGPPDSSALVVSCAPGFVPVKSMEKPGTARAPFIESFSNVPVKITSNGSPWRRMLTVKENFSALTQPVVSVAVPRLPVTVPESVPSLAMVRSAVASSGPSGVVYESFHLPLKSPLGGSDGRAGSRTSNFLPSTKTSFTLVFSAKRAPSVTTRFAIFPVSSEPRRSATPKICAGARVSARSASSAESPASMDFLTAFKMSLGAEIPPE